MVSIRGPITKNLNKIVEIKAQITNFQFDEVAAFCSLYQRNSQLHPMQRITARTGP